MSRLRFQRENGLLNREVRKWFPKKPLCESNANKIAPVGLQEAKSAILILVHGIWIAIVLCALEILIRRFQTFIKQLKLKKFIIHE